MMKKGRDTDLEKQANALLKAGAKPKGTRDDREIERALFEAGMLTESELEFFDPLNDWDSRHSSYALTTSDVDAIEPTQSAAWIETDGYSELVAFDDDNIRHRNRDREERLPLLRRTDTETEQAGPATKAAPTQWSVNAVPLGQLDKGGRKTCATCGMSKGLEFFSPYPRNKDGLHSSCKACRRRNAKESYVRKSETKSDD